MDRLVQAGPGPAPFTKGTFLQGTVFPVDSRFSTRARARPGQASLGWAGLAGLARLAGLAGLAPQAAEPARLPAVCEIRLLSTLRDLASQHSARSGFQGAARAPRAQGTRGRVAHGLAYIFSSDAKRFSPRKKSWEKIRALFARCSLFY